MRRSKKCVLRIHDEKGGVGSRIEWTVRRGGEKGGAGAGEEAMART